VFRKQLCFWRAWVKCGLADQPTGKLQTKPADQVRSLPDGQSTGPHYLYKSYLPCCRCLYFNCIRCSVPTEHHLPYEITQVKGGDIKVVIQLLIGSQFHHYGASPVICATSATLQSFLDVGSTATSKITWVERENCSRWHHCRCAGHQCREFVCKLLTIFFYWHLTFHLLNC